jgi:glycine/D-amino acid oxidase-like deaminating enzyme/nitrite reductase/ring-hydroxylating ferredoxin subunit
MANDHDASGIGSLWIEPSGRRPLAALEGDREVDVAVIGGGLVGLTAAWMLTQEGRSVALLEAGRIGTRTTGHSTAKVTSQHSLVYARLCDERGRDAAQQYADANEYGRGEIDRLVRTLDIACDLEPQDAYVYTRDPERLPDLLHETDAARTLGLPARLSGVTPLPYPVAGAVVFEQQSQLDPFAYLEGLAVRLADQAAVFEHTRVHEVRNGSPCKVVTDRGTVRAAHVIVATQLPVLDRGLFFARAFPFSHAVIAARLRRDAPSGMYISVDEPTRSLRFARRDGASWLVLSGPRLPVSGTIEDNPHQALERFAFEHFAIDEITHRWTNMDYESPDGLPYVGPILPGRDHILIATAFAGWGFSGGTAAARILVDRIQGRENPWASLFDPQRLLRPWSAWAQLAGKNLKSGRTLISGRVSRAAGASPASLDTREGGVFEHRGEKVAVARSEDGRLCAVSAICTHQGCVVGWNRAMQTWACPCHGSEFDIEGQIIRGPRPSPSRRKKSPRRRLPTAKRAHAESLEARWSSAPAMDAR